MTELGRTCDYSRTLRQLKDIAALPGNAFRRPFGRKHDYKRFLCEAPDFTQLDLERSAEIGRLIEL